MNPRILLSRQLWASAAYLLSYIIVGTALFEVAVTIVVTAGVLSVTLAGLPLLIIAAALVRGCAEVERGRVLLVDPAGIPSPYLPIRGSGVFAEVKARWTDPATRRDLAYLVGLFLPLVVVDSVVVGLWLVFLAGITVPLWYWAIPDGWGFFVGDTGSALAAAGLSFVLFTLASSLVVRMAFTHARIAGALLGPCTDPMAEAKRILVEPGPLRV